MKLTKLKTQSKNVGRETLIQSKFQVEKWLFLSILKLFFTNTPPNSYFHKVNLFKEAYIEAIKEKLNERI